MNERIKELADEAIVEKLTLDEFIEALKKEPHDFYGFRLSELEKFAELIVRVCANVIPETSGDLLGTYRDQIYEHFGIINESSN